MEVTTTTDNPVKAAILAQAAVAAAVGLALKPIQFAGQDMFIREMSAAERDDYEAGQVERQKTGKDLENFRARLLVRVLVDASGKRHFADGDAEQLGNLPASVVRQAFNAASKLNAVNDASDKDIAKNS